MASTEYEIVGIGNAIVDVIASTDDAFLAAHQIDKGLMTLMDSMAAARLYAKMPTAIEMSGGSCANTIAGLASLGASTCFVGKVKNDQLGDVFTHDIRALGVAFDTPPTQTGPPTARCLILVTPDAQRSMNTFLGACVDLGPDDVEPATIEAAAITYLEGYLWDPAAAKQAFLKAADIAHKAGRQVALSLSDPFCVDRHRDDFRTLVRDEIDILFANEAEIMSLYQVETFDEALHAVRQECRIAALTRSEAGSVIVSDEEIHVIDADKPPAVVDTTGAGDLYAAGFLFGLVRGKDLATCGRIASVTAAEAVSHYGPRPQTSLKELIRAKGF